MDEIPSELLREAGDECVTLLRLPCVKIWRTGEWPVDWVTEDSLYHCRRKRTYNRVATTGPSSTYVTM